MSRAAIVRAQLQVERCTRCPLAGNNVAMRSPVAPSFMVLGEAPGRREVQKAAPFTGPAGRKLSKALERAGLDPEVGAYMNTVSCLPDRQPPTPSSSEIAACFPNRKAQIAAAGCEVVLACGNVAVRTWRTDVAIGTCWGVPFVRGDLVVVPSIHPAAVLRDASQGWKLDKACRMLARVVAPKPGDWLLGEFCLSCNRRVEDDGYDRDLWPFCRRHLKKELTAKKREKLKLQARTRANLRKQETMFP